MKKSHLLAAFAGTFLAVALLVSVLPAQPPSAPVSRAPRTAGNVALLDINYIFQKHTRFQAMKADMRADMERTEALMKREADAIGKLQESLAEFRSGTPDYKATDEEIAKRKSDLNVQMQLQRKEFLQREAKIYHTVYNEIQQEVSYYATRNGISAVLRFNGDPVNVDKAEDVLRDINKMAIWFNPELDITPVILEQMERRAGPKSPDPVSRRTHGVPPRR